MAHLRNPAHRPHLDLVADTPTWDALKVKFQAYIDARPNEPTLDEDEMRATVDPLFAANVDEMHDRFWNQMVSDLHLGPGPG